MKRTRVDLGDGDACIVFRRDGTQELQLPNQDHGDELLATSMQVARCITLLTDPRAAEALKRVDELIKAH